MDDYTTELCKRASTEEDGKKLMQLISQIIESLDKETKTELTQGDDSS